ncbi:hypothetical protein GCM10009718_20920 [Isoptericola halotolerans]|uniref:Uncharacterized protein n=1 Tax=Isoptericola halotolerans TaxID=300560 RepID=A0ABX2A9Z9_9MICO|nr:hypothetical protein [Isoptericola halotolerans]NOV98975.1 hypothetical protein [Isoptericola halotolerans]
MLILDELSPWDTVYATPQGRFVRDTTVVAERTDVSGAWEPVDPRLEVDGEGGLRVVSPVVEMELAGATGPGESFASLATKDGDLGLAVTVGLGEPTVQENRAVYPVLDADGALIEDAELVVRISPDTTGLTPVLVLGTPGAADAVLAMVGEDGLGFEISTGQGLELVQVGSDEVGVTVVAEGEGAAAPVLEVLPAYQWDSAGIGLGWQYGAHIESGKYWTQH